MDETPVYMDMLPHSTYNKKAEKTVLIKSTGHEKSRFTTVLAVMADGTKLPPMLIFKRKTKPPGTFPPGIIVHQHVRGGWTRQALSFGWRRCGSVGLAVLGGENPYWCGTPSKPT